jgi:hypothetical protein
MADVRLGRAVVDFDANLSPLSSAIQKAQGQVGAASRSMTQALGGVRTSASGVLTAFRGIAGVDLSTLLGTAGLGGIVAGSVRAAMATEQLLVSYSRLTGSMDRAQRLLDSTRRLANALGQEFYSTANAVRDFATKGTQLRDIPGLIEALSDASQGNTERFKNAALAFTQVMGKGYLAAEEMNQQFAEAGVSLQMVATGLSKVRGHYVSVSQLQADMQKKAISASEFARALVLGVAASPLGGASRQMANTTSGQMTRIKNDFIELGTTIGTTLLPYLKSFATWLEKTIAYLNTPAGKAMVTNVTKSAIKMAEFGAATFTAVKGAQLLASTWNGILTAVSAVSSFMAVHRAHAAIAMSSGATPPARTRGNDPWGLHAMGLGQHAPTLWTRMKVEPLGRVGMAIDKGLEKVPTWLRNITSSAARVGIVLAGIIAAITLLSALFRGMGNNGEKAGEAIRPTIQALYKAIRSVVQAVADVIGVFINAGNATNSTLTPATQLAKVLGTLLVPVLNVVADALQLVAGILQGNFQRAGAAVLSILLDIVDAFLGLMRAITAFTPGIEDFWMRQINGVRKYRDELHTKYMPETGFKFKGSTKTPTPNGFDVTPTPDTSAADAAAATANEIADARKKASADYWATYSQWYGEQRPPLVAQLRGMEGNLKRLRGLKDNGTATSQELEDLHSLEAEYAKLYRQIQTGDKLILLQRTHLETVKQAATKDAIDAADAQLERASNTLRGTAGVVDVQADVKSTEGLRVLREQNAVTDRLNEANLIGADRVAAIGEQLALNADTVKRLGVEIERVNHDMLLTPDEQRRQVAELNSQLTDAQDEAAYLQDRLNLELHGDKVVQGLLAIAQITNDLDRKTAETMLQQRLAAMDTIREQHKRDTADALAAELRAIAAAAKARDEALAEGRAGEDLTREDTMRQVERDMATRQAGETRVADAIGGAYAEQMRIRHQAEQLELSTEKKRLDLNARYTRAMADARLNNASESVLRTLETQWKNELRALQQDRDLNRLQLKVDLDKSAIEQWKDAFLTFMQVSVLRNPYFQQGLKAGMSALSRTMAGAGPAPGANVMPDFGAKSTINGLSTSVTTMDLPSGIPGYRLPEQGLIDTMTRALQVVIPALFGLPAPTAAQQPVEIALTITNDTDGLFKVIADVADDRISIKDARAARSVRFA